jgi:nicotinate-nucleotide adenylyltransferase
MEQNMEEAPIEHLVLLAHGIDGAPSDMHAVRDALMELHETGLETWETEVNQGSKTHDGVECCAERYWAALQVKLGEILILANKASETLRISMVGHSFGGLVLRSVASRLFATQPFGERMKLDTLVCIASPHLGCRLLGRGGAGGLAPLMTAFGLSIMRAGLRMIKGKTGPDLLLDNGALEALCNGTHAEALRAFERRIIYCNGTMDWLVNVESASLLTAEEMARRFPQAKLFWIMGGDQWEALPRWKHPEKISAAVEFAVLARGESPKPRDGFRLHVIPGAHPASATAIRDALQRGENTPEDLDPDVARYILANRIYSS